MTNLFLFKTRVLIHSLLLSALFLPAFALAKQAVEQPQQVVAIHQSAIENMLRLELQQHLIGVAFIDDELPEHLANRLIGVPNLAKQLPSREQLLALKPDLIYAGFPSAFTPSTLGSAAWWQDKGSRVIINPYTKKTSFEPIHWSDAWQDLHQIAAIFGVNEKAKQLENTAFRRLPKLKTNEAKPRVLLIDAYSLQANIGACCGGVDLLIRLAGGENIGSEFKGRWTQISWEKVAQSNPDIIIIADYQRGPTEAVINKLNQHPLLSRINAVKQQQIITLPFTETIASPRIIDGIEKLHHFIEQK